MQKAFEKPVEQEITYSVTKEEGCEKRTYLSLNTVVGTDLDPVLYVAFQILEYALIDAPGCSLKAGPGGRGDWGRISSEAMRAVFSSPTFPSLPRTRTVSRRANFSWR